MFGTAKIIPSLDKQYLGTGDEDSSIISNSQSGHGSQRNNEEELHRLDSEPSPLARLLLPAFKFFRFIGFSPSWYSFDPSSQKFIRSGGHVAVKVLCMLMGALAAVHTYGSAKLWELQVKNNTILVMIKMLGACSTVYVVTFFHALLTKGENFREMLDFLQHACRQMCKAGCKLPSIFKIHVISTGLILGCMIICTLYTIGTADGRQGASMYEGLHEYIHAVADTEAKVVSLLLGMQWNGTEMDGQNYSESHSFGPVLVVAMISLVLNWVGSMCWCGAITMNTLWALVFWLLLHEFLHAVNTSCSRNTLHDLRKFNTVTSVIDKYNHAFGPVILASVSTGIMYFSVNIFQLFRDGGDWMHKVTTFGSFFWFGIMLVTSAQVNKEAGNIVETIKARFQVEQVWKEHHGNCIETVQGLMLVLHELQTNSIGFKGLGFFTCTYGFIGTVLSAIATYAVIVIQFQT